MNDLANRARKKRARKEGAGINDFIEKGGDDYQAQKEPPKEQRLLDPSGKRNYKSICVPLNEWEHEHLQQIIRETGVSSVAAFRMGLRQLGENLKISTEIHKK